LDRSVCSGQQDGGSGSGMIPRSILL